ncbi:MAG: sugar-binding protein, partial [Acidobacteriota bacterium]
MNAPVKIIALLLVLLGQFSPAQFPPVIDGRKDPFYSRLTDSTQGFIHIPHTDFVSMHGPRPNGESDLSADVWIAWDETYFYLYAEVKDDIVRVASPVRPWNDCIELKFDPDPGKKSWTGIINARLSALDSADASEEKGVDNLYREKDSLLSWEAANNSNYARRKTSDGYALELRLAWKWMKVGDRVFHVGAGNVFGLAITVHDNDGGRTRLNTWELASSIQWSAGMADAVWLAPQLLGTIEFAPDHKLKFIRRNAIDTTDVRTKAFLSLARFKLKYHEAWGIMIENWRYHSGDNIEWAKPEFDDRAWSITYPWLTKEQQPGEGWNGIGWFRAELVVDSSLWGMPLGLFMFQTGASEVYLDGKLLYRFGKVGRSHDEEEAFYDRNLKPVVFKDRQVHILAVRYSNFSAEHFYAADLNAGFACSFLHNLDAWIVEFSERILDRTVYQVIYTLLPLVIGAMHLFFFFFYPRRKENLYFAIFLFCWAYIVFIDYQKDIASNRALILEMRRIVALAKGGALVFGMLTVYSGISEKPPVQFYAITLATAGIAAWNYLSPIGRFPVYCLYSLMGLTAL